MKLKLQKNLKLSNLFEEYSTHFEEESDKIFNHPLQKCYRLNNF